MKEIIKNMEPTDYLSPYVKYYWAYSDNVEFTSLKFPIGSTQLIFHRGKGIYTPETDKSQDVVTLCGQSNYFAHMQSMGDLDMIIVFFTPIGMRTFFDFSVSEIYNHEVSASDIDDYSLCELGRRVCDCKDAALSIYIIDLWLRKRLNERYSIRRILPSLVELAQNPYVDIDQAASLACLSRKQYGRVFKDVVGMNPKEFQRILRFQRALYLMQQGCRNEQEMAVACNYSDSAHLIREFKSLTGFTPLELVRQQMPYSDFYSLPTLSTEL